MDEGGYIVYSEGNIVDDIQQEIAGDETLSDIEENESDEDIDSDEEVNEIYIPTKEKKVRPEDRKTVPILNLYEYLELLKIRIEQINSGEKILVLDDNILNKCKTVKDIAKYEIKHKLIPFVVKRKLPNGNVEIWNLNELEFDRSID